MQTQCITWPNGFRLNTEPVFISDEQEIYVVQIYAENQDVPGLRKAETRKQCLSTANDEHVGRYQAELLGI